MTQTLATIAPPESGSPRTRSAAEEAIYGDGEGTVFPHPQPVSFPGAPVSPPAAVAPTAREISVSLLVNGVGLTMLAAHVDIRPHSICCVLAREAISLTLPLTDDVELSLRGETYKVGFLGGWHRIDQLGVSVVVFPRREV